MCGSIIFAENPRFIQIVGLLSPERIQNRESEEEEDGLIRWNLIAILRCSNFTEIRIDFNTIGISRKYVSELTLTFEAKFQTLQPRVI